MFEITIICANTCMHLLSLFVADHSRLNPLLLEFFYIVDPRLLHTLLFMTAQIFQ